MSAGRVGRPVDPAEYQARKAKAIDQYLKANTVPDRVARGLKDGRPVPGMSLKQFEMIGGHELLLETEHARVLRVWVHSAESPQPTFYVVRLSLKDDLFESVTLSR